MTNKYSHLHPSRWEIADGSRSERLKRIASDIYIEHARIAPISRYMDYLFELPKKIRMPCLLISSPAGMGKTTLLDHFVRRHIVNEARNCERPVVITSVPAAPELKHVQSAVLESLNAPMAEIRPWMTRVELIRKMLREYKTRVLVVDELQHSSNLSRRDQTSILHWIKSLSTDLRIVIVGAGVSGVEIPIQADAQLSTRFRTMDIPAWTEGPDLAGFLDAYERACPLRNPSGLGAKAMMRALVRCSDGITDTMVQCLGTLARAAINNGTEHIAVENVERWRDYQ